MPETPRYRVRNIARGRDLPRWILEREQVKKSRWLSKRDTPWVKVSGPERDPHEALSKAWAEALMSGREADCEAIMAISRSLPPRPGTPAPGDVVGEGLHGETQEHG